MCLAQDKDWQLSQRRKQPPSNKKGFYPDVLKYMRLLNPDVISEGVTVIHFSSQTNVSVQREAEVSLRCVCLYLCLTVGTRFTSDRTASD